MTEQSEYNENTIPKWEALGHHSIKEYQGWCYFNDVESQSYNPDITSEELDKLVDSGSFSETHIQISKLSKYADKFDKNQILKFLNGYYRNPQINWISTDNDVKDFLRLIQNNQHYSIELRKSAREQLDDEIDLTEEPLAT